MLKFFNQLQGFNQINFPNFNCHHSTVMTYNLNVLYNCVKDIADKEAWKSEHAFDPVQFAEFEKVLAKTPVVISNVDSVIDYEIQKLADL